MCEILFRGKRLDNGEWAYGVPLFYSGGQFGIVKCTSETRILPYGEDTTFHYVEELFSPKVYPTTIGQYIGRDDKNGVKIFKGDIVKTKYGRLYKVVWFSPKLCFDLEPIDKPENLSVKAPDKWDLWYSENLEVVGNIYDNPELLGTEVG